MAIVLGQDCPLCSLGTIVPYVDHRCASLPTGIASQAVLRHGYCNRCSLVFHLPNAGKALSVIAFQFVQAHGPVSSEEVEVCPCGSMTFFEDIDRQREKKNIFCKKCLRLVAQRSPYR